MPAVSDVSVLATVTVAADVTFSALALADVPAAAGTTGSDPSFGCDLLCDM